jgi:hypothetical protein
MMNSLIDKGLGDIVGDSNHCFNAINPVDYDYYDSIESI